MKNKKTMMVWTLILFGLFTVNSLSNNSTLLGNETVAIIVNETIPNDLTGGTVLELPVELQVVAPEQEILLQPENKTVFPTLDELNLVINNTIFNQTPAVDEVGLALEAFVLPKLPDEQCTPEWTELKTSCRKDGTILGFYVDINDCYSLTGKDEDKQAPPDTSYPCEFNVIKPVIQEPPRMILKDGSEWRVLEQDDIFSYINFNFVYLNDNYYRVDWRWNEDYIKDVLQLCFLTNENTINRCITKVLIDYDIFYPFKITPKNGSIGNSYELENIYRCGNNVGCVNNLSANTDYNIKTINFTKENFLEKYLQINDFQKKQEEIAIIHQNGVPSFILKGNANIIGTFNPLNREKGSFYIDLINNSFRSDGLSIKFGLNSLLIQFNNSKTTEEITFSGNENITRYLDLDKNSNVSSAFLSIIGKRTSNGTVIITDTEDVWGTSNGYDASNSVDENWGTYSAGNQTFPYIFVYENFTIPQGIYFSNWTGKYYVLNHNVSVMCFNSSSSWEQIISVEYANPTGWNFTKNVPLSCLSGQVLQVNNTIHTEGMLGEPAWYYEGKVTWIYEQFPYNPFIDVGMVDGDYEWNWVGEFNSSHGLQMTGDFVNEINSYLTTCTPDANNRCQVPITFHSDTAGKLQYSNLNVTYNNYPRNPNMDAGNDSIIDWNYFGEFKIVETTPDFSQDLQQYLDNPTLCPPEQNTCLIPLVFNSNSKGILNISNLNIQYYIYDTSAPTIHSIMITPNPANESNTLTLLVNASDNVNLTKVNATLLSQKNDLTYNPESKLYEGTLTAPNEGIYLINVTATDWKNLTATSSTQLSVTSVQAELTLTPEDLTYQPSQLTETVYTLFSALVHNYGETAANNFLVQLLIDGQIQTTNTLTVPPQSTNLTQLGWMPIYGNHTVTIKVDTSNIIPEDNETNNNASFSVSVLDGNSPVISQILANPVIEGTPLAITVNASDNVGINVVTATINDATIILGYNVSSGLYQNSTIAPGDGTYNLTITSLDLSGLVTSQKITVEIYPSQADLILDLGSVLLPPPPLNEGGLLNLGLVIKNKGGTAVQYTKTEFLVDGVSIQNISQTFLPESINTTQISWMAAFGQHLLTFRTDALNNVTESNDNNNEVNFSIVVQDATAPIINQVITPNSVYVNSEVSIKVNASDNVNISQVNATLVNTLILTYNSSSGLYEGATTAPAVTGTYQINVTALDINSLSSKKQQPITVNPAEADLTLDAGDIIQTPLNPAEPEILGVNVTIRNEGGTDANNFAVRFTINSNIQEQNLSVTKASANSTYFSWNSTYSNHTFTISADYYNNIAESNESNNVYTKNIFVMDIIPPPAPILTASPNNWTIQNTHTISFNPVSDPNGVNHYEYQIDAGSWVNLGLNTSFTTSAQSEGVHTVYVRAVDNPGNLGTFGNVSLYIDTSNPNTPIIKEWHSGNNWTEHESPYYTWANPGDVGSGVVSYVGDFDGTLFSLGNNNSYHLNVTPGSHSFRIYAQDASQHNSSWSDFKTVYVDTLPPGLTTIVSTTHLTSNSWYSQNNPLFNFSATDQHSGVSGFYYVINQNESTIPDTMNLFTINNSINITGVGGTDSQFNQSENITGLTDGVWSVHALAKDNVGNLGNASHYLFKVDTTVPSLVRVVPENNTYIGDNPPAVIIDYFDLPSGINVSAITFIFDGSDVTALSTINTTTLSYNHNNFLSSGTHNLSISLADLANNILIYNWTFKISANESEARTAIEQGTINSVLADYLTYTDQQLYVRYQNNTQKLARFDKVITSGNQTWVFNFFTGSESYTNIAGLYNNVLVIWENQTLTPDEISKQVEILINQTKW